MINRNKANRTEQPLNHIFIRIEKTFFFDESCAVPDE